MFEQIVPGSDSAPKSYSISPAQNFPFTSVGKGQLKAAFAHPSLPQRQLSSHLRTVFVPNYLILSGRGDTPCVCPSAPRCSAADGLQTGTSSHPPSLRSLKHPKGPFSSDICSFFFPHLLRLTSSIGNRLPLSPAKGRSFQAMDLGAQDTHKSSWGMWNEAYASGRGDCRVKMDGKAFFLSEDRWMSPN